MRPKLAHGWYPRVHKLPKPSRNRQDPQSEYRSHRDPRDVPPREPDRLLHKLSRPSRTYLPREPSRLLPKLPRPSGTYLPRGPSRLLPELPRLSKTYFMRPSRSSILEVRSDLSRPSYKERCHMSVIPNNKETNNIADIIDEANLYPAIPDCYNSNDHTRWRCLNTRALSYELGNNVRVENYK